jgi:hypothetical protein
MSAADFTDFADPGVLKFNPENNFHGFLPAAIGF